MQNRRDFLKTATLAALGSGLVVRRTLAGESSLSNVYINKLGLGGKMKMSFFPYELKLKHPCGVISRKLKRCLSGYKV